ncbi:MAG: hypothetical protein WC475_03050, partial [Candidatus Paceibacterota bacterium]
EIKKKKEKQARQRKCFARISYGHIISFLKIVFFVYFFRDVLLIIFFFRFLGRGVFTDWPE